GKVIVICFVSAAWTCRHPDVRLWSQSLRESKYPERAAPVARVTPESPESRSQAGRPVIDRFDLITSQAAAASDGSNWGASKLRVIRTSQNVFAVYIVDAEKSGEREWRLAQRRDQQWKVIAEGPSGREPVNLLRGPKDELYVISWPNGLPQISRSNT